MNALTVKASEAAGRVVVALAVPFVVLWVLLMFVLVFPVAAADWLYHKIKREVEHRTPALHKKRILHNKGLRLHNKDS